MTVLSWSNFDFGILALPELRETRTMKNVGLVDLIFGSFVSVQVVYSAVTGGVPFSPFVRCEQFPHLKLFKPTFLVPPR
jgi:hypothetical protein